MAWCTIIKKDDGLLYINKKNKKDYGLVYNNEKIIKETTAFCTIIKINQ